MLGWPEKPPQLARQESVNIPPEPHKSDYVSPKMKPNNPIKSYIDYDKRKFFTLVWRMGDDNPDYNPRDEEIAEKFHSNK